MSDFDPLDRPGTERAHGNDEVDRSVYQENIRAHFETLAVVFDDVGDLPATAESRLKAGSFDDPLALHRYLDDGGLVSYDEDGKPVPIGFVYIVEYYDADFDEYYYDVYIDTESGI